MNDECESCNSNLECKMCNIFYLCECGSGLNWEEQYDYQSIYLGRACSKCIDSFRKKYNSWVFTGYDQAFLDQYSGERIEPEYE